MTQPMRARSSPAKDQGTATGLRKAERSSSGLAKGERCSSGGEDKGAGAAAAVVSVCVCVCSAVQCIVVLISRLVCLSWTQAARTWSQLCIEQCLGCASQLRGC